LSGEIISSQTFSFPEKNISMLIAMPNKREKAELIVQKLTEIGVENINFRVSEHSVIRQWNKKKAERLDKISREAVEQSR
jgi:RsmE family RNA methyltransferase